MKSLPFFIGVIMCCYSCADRQPVPAVSKKANPENALLMHQEEPYHIEYNDTVRMPSLSDPTADTGYFKGYVADTIAYFKNEEDTTPLYTVFRNMISTKELKLQLHQTLSHSVFIDQKKALRTDSFTAPGIQMISKYGFGDNNYGQRIYLNGQKIYTTIPKKEDDPQDVFDIDEHSFRYFSFHGEPFYYFEAKAFYMAGISMGNVTYFIIYNIRHKKLSYFSSCRVRHSFFLVGNVNNDNALDFVEFDNSDFCTGVPTSDNFICRLYSCNTNGKFVLQKGKTGKEYFIDARSGYMQDSFIVKASYWPDPVK